MNQTALGLIETAGYAAAVVAADFALKAANVRLVRMETVVGVAKALGVTVYLTGEVAAVEAAVEAGCEAIARFDRVVSRRVIPNLDGKVRMDMLQGSLEI